MCKCQVDRGNAASASCSVWWQHVCKSCVHNSKCASWYKKTQPVQVTGNARCGSRPSWALVEAGCSNQLQLAQEHNSKPDLALVLTAFGYCILLLYTSAQDSLDPLQLMLVVCFYCHQIAEDLTCTCRGMVLGYKDSEKACA